MFLRILTALVALVVVLPPIIWGDFWGLTALGAVATLIGVYEFSCLNRKSNPADILAAEMIAALVIYGVVAYAPPHNTIYIALAILFIYLFHLFRFKSIEDSGPVLMGSIASVFYLPFLLAFLPLIRKEASGLDWIFFLMLVTWAGDSGAYLSGRAFGRHKLYSEVSPKKTLEGVAGGAVASIAVAFLARATFFEQLSFVECLMLAPILDIAGVTGDLAESLLKRSAGIKDSGKIFPGHGGILDRLDSLLFSAPLLYAYIILMK